MSIIFKPVGSLNISTSPTDLPQQTDGSNIISGDFQRCKNLRLDQMGKAVLRDGSTKINGTPLAHSIEYILESGGVRYTFCGDYVYRNETLITDGVQCATPDYDNDEGQYGADVTVTITCDTLGVDIYYTMDGSTPSEASQLYVTPVLVPLYSYLKSIAIRDGFLDSEVKSAYYSSTSAADLMTEGAGSGNSEVNDLYTEDGDDLYTEV